MAPASSLRNNGSSIQGRRIDSPDLKVAVNKEAEQHSRPHTAGHPLLPRGVQQSKRDDYMTIGAGGRKRQPEASNMSSGNNTILIGDRHGLNMTAQNVRKVADQAAETRKPRGNATI